jgi:ribosomal-protein-alanine N-acetyltransferase
MPLPILKAYTDATPENLVRLFHRTELHWVRHLGEEAQLDAGVAFTNPELTAVGEANGVVDAAVPPGVSPADAVDEVRRHFEATGTTCRRWLLNPAAPEAQTRPLGDYLVSAGWRMEPYDIMYLAGRPAAPLAEADGLTVIPARASFRHAREIAEEAAAECGVPQLADASMLHLDDPHWDAAVALREGKAVARAGVLAVGDVGRIEHVFVSAADRRRGVGRTMVARALEVCARSLFKHVMLCVRPDDAAAIDLYTRFGFRTIGQMSAYGPSARVAD